MYISLSLWPAHIFFSSLFDHLMESIHPWVLEQEGMGSCPVSRCAVCDKKKNCYCWSEFFLLCLKKGSGKMLWTWQNALVTELSIEFDSKSVQVCKYFQSPLWRTYHYHNQILPVELWCPHQLHLTAQSCVKLVQNLIYRYLDWSFEMWSMCVHTHNVIRGSSKKIEMCCTRKWTEPLPSQITLHQ